MAEWRRNPVLRKFDGCETGTSAGGSDPESFLPRARRFPIQARLDYRQRGEKHWHHGTTINISRSGVLFQAECDLTRETVIEMKIVFPSEITGGAPAQVVCWGPVVRCVPPSASADRPSLAAAILRYRLGSD
jgi:hypothetical protein